MYGNQEGDQPSFILGDTRIIHASREPCIVCGHPTGDCADGAVDSARMLTGANMYEKKQSEPIDVLVPEDFYEERQITPFSRAKVLVAKKGTFVTAEKAKQLGII